MESAVKRRKWRMPVSSDRMLSTPIQCFIEALCAGHLSSYVDAPFSDLGGIIICGPPGVLKTSMLEVVGAYPNAVVVSDLNVQSLSEMRESIASKTIRTLIIPELAKLYERDPRTAANVEGHIRALVDEGFRAPSFKSQQMVRLSAHCVVLTAITESAREEHYKRWNDTGFNRRFLWPLIRLERPEVLDEAADEWKALDFRLRYLPQPPTQGRIINTTRPSERKILRSLLKYQPGPTHTTQAHLMTRMLAVLKWWYRMDGRGPGAAMRTMRVFARSLGQTGAELSIAGVSQNGKASKGR